jgi:hypothetical protein
VPLQLSLEQLLEAADAVVQAQPPEAQPGPGPGLALDDEGAGAGVEAVGVAPDPAGPGLHEGEGEGLEHLGRAQPHVAVAAGVDAGPEAVRVAAAQPAVGAVAGHHQVGPAEPGRVLDLGLEAHADAELPGPGGEDVEQPLAAHAVAEPGQAGRRLAVDQDVLVLPAEGLLGDRLGGRRVVGPQALDQVVPEHHPPAVGDAGRVALEDGDVVARVAPLHQDGQVQPGRAATDADDPHARLSPSSGRGGAGAPAAPPCWRRHSGGP